jgi:hypothetical protein
MSDIVAITLITVTDVGSDHNYQHNRYRMYRTFPRLPGNSMERFAAKSSVVSARAYIYSLFDKSSAMIHSCLSAAARLKSVISDKSLSKVKKDSTGRIPKTVKYVPRPILCESSNFGRNFPLDSSGNILSLVL